MVRVQRSTQQTWNEGSEAVFGKHRVGATAWICHAWLPACAAGPVVLVGGERRIAIGQVLHSEHQPQALESTVGEAVIVGNVAIHIRVPVARNVVPAGYAGGLFIAIAVAV